MSASDNAPVSQLTALDDELYVAATTPAGASKLYVWDEQVELWSLDLDAE